MAPSSVGGGKIKSSQEESNLLLSMPPADARAAQGKIVSRADAQPGASPAEPDLKVTWSVPVRYCCAGKTIV